ncbi:hypothetical protein DPMN_194848 [Dreissena polymorpha]|uniref:Uncharacterized protein n=1 Tax=Dreissena polymorpha TaxID=45954 RepID=A0A9D3Y605_DREPO|nr:hypothetical protein DPMN_194848 [Dreissena polymorpha]
MRTEQPNSIMDCPVSTVIGKLTSNLGYPGVIQAPRSIAFGWWSPFWTGVVSSEYSGVPPQ